jgi:hypothetical protein
MRQSDASFTSSDASTKAHFANVSSIILDGVSHTPAEVRKILQDRIDKADATTAAMAAYRKAVSDEQSGSAEASAIYLALKGRVLNDFKTQADVLGDFGLVLKKRRAPSAETVAKAVQAREQKRLAREAAKNGSAPPAPKP